MVHLLHRLYGVDAPVVIYEQLATPLPSCSDASKVLRTITTFVLLSVCLSVRSHISEPNRVYEFCQIFGACNVTVAVAWTSSGGVAIRDVLTVSWTTLCLSIIGQAKTNGVGHLLKPTRHLTYLQIHFNQFSMIATRDQ